MHDIILQNPCESSACDLPEYSGDDYSISCAPNSAIRLHVPDGEAISDVCCPSGTTCVAVRATGSFGTLRSGPLLLSARADDPLDQDDDLNMITELLRKRSPAIEKVRRGSSVYAALTIQKEAATVRNPQKVRPTGTPLIEVLSSTPTPGEGNRDSDSE